MVTLKTAQVDARFTEADVLPGTRRASVSRSTRRFSASRSSPGATDWPDAECGPPVAVTTGGPHP
ncbi:hypothetical protein AB0I54_48210, partial [Streptomyces sp. NPDC050625]|uniref:hypothetical protein n=1 Tax=Streptomyces sp. NPDC050625 TaxID=3154629 RepID=UPI003426DA33